MQYEITISGRLGTESEVEAQEVVRLMVSAFKLNFPLCEWSSR